jgi:hypothetical protein
MVRSGVYLALRIVARVAEPSFIRFAVLLDVVWDVALEVDLEVDLELACRAWCVLAKAFL